MPTQKPDPLLPSCQSIIILGCSSRHTEWGSSPTELNGTDLWIDMYMITQYHSSYGQPIWQPPIGVDGGGDILSWINLNEGEKVPKTVQLWQLCNINKQITWKTSFYWLGAGERRITGKGKKKTYGRERYPVSWCPSYSVQVPFISGKLTSKKVCVTRVGQN